MRKYTFKLVAVASGSNEGEVIESECKSSSMDAARIYASAMAKTYQKERGDRCRVAFFDLSEDVGQDVEQPDAPEA